MTLPAARPPTTKNRPDLTTIPRRLVLADDHLAFREALATALQQEMGLTIVGQATDARATCAILEQTRPDVLVADLMLKDTDAVALLRELRRRRLLVPTLVLSRHASPLFADDAVKAGARGFALKSQSLREIADAIEVVARGETYRAPALCAADEAEVNEDGTRLATLSRREREILSRIVEGRSNDEIARALFISRRTVDSHRCRMNRKLGVSSPLQLLKLAARAGLIE